MERETEFAGKLSPLQACVFHHLKGGNDVEISTLYIEMHSADVDVSKVTHEWQQRQVGALISRINRKLREGGYGHVIRPGQARRTYRLYRAES